MIAVMRGSTCRRAVVFGALWLAISGAALLTPGCYGRNCEGSFESFGVDAGDGRMIDENTWESGPIDGTYLWFPRQRLYEFEIVALGGRTPYKPEAYLSVTPEPTKGGGFVKAAGNLAVFPTVGPNRVAVWNDSCSDYYLRIVLDADPLPPAVERDGEADAGIGDASEEEDAAASDAGDAEAGD